MKKVPAAVSEKPPEILLVDDNRQGLIARKTLLTELGYQVTTATDGEEALKLFSQRNFNVVVTDYKMPRMNGCELIGHVRQLRWDIPIILLSGFVEPLGLCEQSTGADVVISKSDGEVAHLTRAVKRLLSRPPARKPPVSAAPAPIIKAQKA